MEDPGYNYCAPVGQCETTVPSWGAFRKYRGYLWFDLSSLPTGQVISASLALKKSDSYQVLGGALQVVQVARVKTVDWVCEWDEMTLDSIQGMTWSTLPQNLLITPEGVWSFGATKAVQDWLNGNEDIPGMPIAPNCGVVLWDPEMGSLEEPLLRWIDFSSKEGSVPPILHVVLDLAPGA